MATLADLADSTSGMTAEQVVKICQSYCVILNDLGAKPFQERSAATREARLNHLRWMCDQAIVEASSATTEAEVKKAMRWLCFVQGAFWTMDIRTIDQMRDDNR